MLPSHSLSPPRIADHSNLLEIGDSERREGIEEEEVEPPDLTPPTNTFQKEPSEGMVPSHPNSSDQHLKSKGRRAVATPHRAFSEGLK